MTLSEIIQRRQGERAVDRDRFKGEVDALIRDLREWVKELPFEVEDWNVLVQILDERLNLTALTIQFKDDQVTVQPRSFIAGRRPQVEVSSGARVALLEYVEGEGWMYGWEGVRGPLVRLTKETFRDEILVGLLR